MPVDVVRALARRAAQGRRGPLRATSACSRSPLYPQLVERFDLPVDKGALVQVVQPTAARPTRPGIRGGNDDDPLPGPRVRDGRRHHHRHRRDSRSTTPTTCPRRSSSYDPGQKVTLRCSATARSATVERQARRAAACSAAAYPMRELVRDLAHGAARDRAAASSGRTPGARTRATGAGGDVTFAIDAEAEAFTRGVPGRATRRRWPSTRRTAGWSRPAARPSACSSSTRSTARGRRSPGSRPPACRVALAPLGDGEPTMGDVDVGCVVEIKSRRVVRSPSAARAAERRAGRASREHGPRPDVLGLRLPRPARRARWSR